MSLVPATPMSRKAETRERVLAWLVGQTPATRARHCEHGHYIGFEGALRFTCEDCNPDGAL